MGKDLFEAFTLWRHFALKEMALFDLYKQQSCKNNAAGCVKGGGGGQERAVSFPPGHYSRRVPQIRPLEGQFLVQQWCDPKLGLFPWESRSPSLCNVWFSPCWCFPFRWETARWAVFCFVSWENGTFSNMRGQAEKEKAGNNDSMVAPSAQSHGEGRNQQECQLKKRAHPGVLFPGLTKVLIRLRKCLLLEIPKSLSTWFKKKMAWVSIVLSHTLLNLSPALSWNVLAFNCQCQKIASCQKRQGIVLLLEHSL